MNNKITFGNHSRYRPSASSIWLNCLGSLKYLNNRKYNLPNKYSEEGNEAHKVLATFDKNNYDPDNEKEQNAYYFYQYIDHILENKKYKIYKEVKLSHRLPNIFGFVDFIAYNKKEVHIVDYKYGKFIKVDAYKNTQLLMYAILAFYTLKLKKQKKWIIHIVQPRIGYCDKYELTKRELLQFNSELIKKYKKSFFDRPYNPGPEQCRFCPGSKNLLCKAYLESKIKNIII